MTKELQMSEKPESPAPKNLVTVSSAEQYTSILSEDPKRVSLLYFSAEWAEPCKTMDIALRQIAVDNPALMILEIEQESKDHDEEQQEVMAMIAEECGVNAVPTFVYLKGHEFLERFEGADVEKLKKTAHYYSASMAKSAAALSKTDQLPAPAQPSATSDMDVDDGEFEGETTAQLYARIDAIIAKAPIVLFMKGTPDAPRCGFSRQAVALLRDHNVEFDYFDILTDENVRNGLKKKNDWPTFPQLMHRAELLGGLDIMKELAESGELDVIAVSELEKKEAEEKKREEAEKKKQEVVEDEDDEYEGETAKELYARIDAIVAEAPVVLFMKGTPDAPRCGFSRQAVALLRDHNISFHHFDILTDENVRNGLKKKNDWPTFPQLMHDKELLGGLDIMKELAESGELDAIAEEGKKKSQA